MLQNKFLSKKKCKGVHISLTCHGMWAMDFGIFLRGGGVQIKTANEQIWSINLVPMCLNF